MNDKIISELKKYNEVYNKDIKPDKLIEANNAFSEQGHSGFSARYAINYIEEMLKDPVETKKILDEMLENNKDDGYGMQKVITDNIMEIYNIMKDASADEKNIIVKLLNHDPITPILGTDDEWNEVTFNGGKCKTYQNKRCYSIFKDVYPNGLSIAYDSNATCHSDDGGLSWFSSGRFGRKQITFPYEPKKENIYIYEPEEGLMPYILTDEATISKLKEIKDGDSNE